jgi:sugar phosphate permease
MVQQERTSTAPTTGKTGRQRGGRWRRQLDHYPTTGRWMGYLSIVVLVTVAMYYQLYVGGSVSTLLAAQYGMTFRFLIYISIFGGIAGAFASLLAGAADRWGRANMVVYGSLITSALTLFGLPHAPSKGIFLVISVVISVVEGMVLVATPALVRDFSPQLGRAAAMGFWTLGPVLGSLVVTEVAAGTLDSHPDWRFQFYVCGTAGLVVFVVALFGLRELSPRLRDQLMVSLRDRALVEARARRPEAAPANRPSWRPMLRLDIIGSAFGMSVLLLFYYTAVGFFVAYFVTNHGYSTGQANALATWYWIAEALALVTAGVLSDRLRVRKPFMLAGAVLVAGGVIWFAEAAGEVNTGYRTFLPAIIVIAVGSSMAYAPWMAAFTETVERRDPAATATGLAVAGWITRAVVAVALATLAALTSATSTLVDEGPRVQALSAKYGAELVTLSAIDPATVATLGGDPADAAAQAKAVGEISQQLRISVPEASRRLAAAAKVPPAGLAYLGTHGPEVRWAATEAPGQWRIWWWLCFAGALAFIPAIFAMSGRWSPRRAAADVRGHERQTDQELAGLDRPVDQQGESDESR